MPFEQAPDAADVSIRLDTGPEVLAGSTRLKAGTVTKQVLNRISTLAMARLGKVYGNLMVDVNTRANAKLVERGTSIVQRVTDLARAEAAALLARADGSAKLACVMHRHTLGAAAAARHLAECGGFLRAALERPADAASDSQAARE